MAARFLKPSLMALGHRLLLGGLVAIFFMGIVVAAEDLTYEQEIASLRAMVDEPRDTEVYELDFQPLEFDRILIRDRLGNNQVFHYLTFRLRNRVSDNADYLANHATVYNEILDTMVKEYAFVRKSTEGGARLELDDVRELEDERMAVILEREDLRVRPRTVNLTAIGFDEHGTRFRLFDPVPGEGPQEAFNFDDRGLTVAKGNFYQRVQDAVEERYRQRFYTTGEIRELELPPYQAEQPSTFEDGYGMAQGEVYGVIIFDRLNEHGNHFTLHFQGLSNKQRFEWPERLPQGKVEDYFNLRVLRRTYVMEIARSGDEYNRHRDHFEVISSGWQWIERFLRLEQRRAIAYSRYHRHNIRLPEETSRQGSYPTVDENGDARQGTTDLPVLHDATVASEFWDHYGSIRQNWPDRYEEKLEEHAEHGEEVLSTYQAPEEERKHTEAELERLADERQAWQQVLERHQQRLRERAQELERTLPDWQATTEDR